MYRLGGRYDDACLYYRNENDDLLKKLVPYLGCCDKEPSFISCYHFVGMVTPLGRDRVGWMMDVVVSWFIWACLRREPSRGCRQRCFCCPEMRCRCRYSASYICDDKGFFFKRWWVWSRQRERLPEFICSQGHHSLGLSPRWLGEINWYIPITPIEWIDKFVQIISFNFKFKFNSKRQEI